MVNYFAQKKFEMSFFTFNFEWGNQRTEKFRNRRQICDVLFFFFKGELILTVQFHMLLVSR